MFVLLATLTSEQVFIRWGVKPRPGAGRKWADHFAGKPLLDQDSKRESTLAHERSPVGQAPLVRKGQVQPVAGWRKPGNGLRSPSSV